MASLAKRLVRPLRALRPRFAQEVETVVGPAYARRDELASAVAEIRHLLADQLDGDNEATAVMGRSLAELKASADAMGAELAALRAQLERVEASLAGRHGDPSPSSRPRPA